MHTLTLLLDANISNLLDTFAQLRQSAIDSSSTVGLVATSLAATLAAISYLIIGNKMLKGEKVDVWEFVKPIVIILCISALPSIMRIMDDILNKTTSSIIVSTEQYNLKIKDAINRIEMIYDALEDDGVIRTIENANKKKNEAQKVLDGLGTSEEASSSNYPAGFNGTYMYDPNINEVRKESAQKDLDAANAQLNNIAEIAANVINEKVDRQKSEAEKLSEGFFDMIKRWFGAVKRTGGLSLVHYLSYIVGQFVLAWAELTLCVLIYLAPFVFAFSILPFYSGGITSFFARYIQISFWKVCVGVIEFVSASVKWKALGAKTRYVNEILAGNTDATILDADQHTFILNVISWATILAIFSIPTIATYIIESAGTGGTGSAAASKTGKAAGFVGGSARKLWGVFK